MRRLAPPRDLRDDDGTGGQGRFLLAPTSPSLRLIKNETNEDERVGGAGEAGGSAGGSVRADGGTGSEGSSTQGSGWARSSPPSSPSSAKKVAEEKVANGGNGDNDSGGVGASAGTNSSGTTCSGTASTASPLGSAICARPRVLYEVDVDLDKVNMYVSATQYEDILSVGRAFSAVSVDRARRKKLRRRRPISTPLVRPRDWWRYAVYLLRRKTVYIDLYSRFKRSEKLLAANGGGASKANPRDRAGSSHDSLTDEETFEMHLIERLDFSIPVLVELRRISASRQVILDNLNTNATEAAEVAKESLIGDWWRWAFSRSKTPTPPDIDSEGGGGEQGDGDSAATTGVADRTAGAEDLPLTKEDVARDLDASLDALGSEDGVGNDGGGAAGVAGGGGNKANGRSGGEHANNSRADGDGDNTKDPPSMSSMPFVAASTATPDVLLSLRGVMSNASLCLSDNASAGKRGGGSRRPIVALHFTSSVQYELLASHQWAAEFAFDEFEVRDHVSVNTTFPRIFFPRESAGARSHGTGVAQAGGAAQHDEEEREVHVAGTSNKTAAGRGVGLGSAEDRSMIHGTSSSGRAAGTWDALARAGTLVWIRVASDPAEQKIQIDAHAVSFAVILSAPLAAALNSSFLHPDLARIRAGAFNRLRQWRQRKEMELRDILRSRTRFIVSVDVRAPVIVMPQDVAEERRPILVVDFGRFQIVSAAPASNQSVKRRRTLLRRECSRAARSFRSMSILSEGDDASDDDDEGFTDAHMAHVDNEYDNYGDTGGKGGGGCLDDDDDELDGFFDTRAEENELGSGDSDGDGSDNGDGGADDDDGGGAGGGLFFQDAGEPAPRESERNAKGGGNDVSNMMYDSWDFRMSRIQVLLVRDHETTAESAETKEASRGTEKEEGDNGLQTTWLDRNIDALGGGEDGLDDGKRAEARARVAIVEPFDIHLLVQTCFLPLPLAQTNGRVRIKAAAAISPLCVNVARRDLHDLGRIRGGLTPSHTSPLSHEEVGTRLPSRSSDIAVEEAEDATAVDATDAVTSGVGENVEELGGNEGEGRGESKGSERTDAGVTPRHRTSIACYFVANVMKLSLLDQINGQDDVRFVDVRMDRLSLKYNKQNAGRKVYLVSLGNFEVFDCLQANNPGFDMLISSCLPETLHPRPFSQGEGGEANAGDARDSRSRGFVGAGGSGGDSGGGGAQPRDRPRDNHDYELHRRMDRALIDEEAFAAGAAGGRRSPSPPEESLPSGVPPPESPHLDSSNNVSDGSLTRDGGDLSKDLVRVLVVMDPSIKPTSEQLDSHVREASSMHVDIHFNVLHIEWNPETITAFMVFVKSPSSPGPPAALLSTAPPSVPVQTDPPLPSPSKVFTIGGVDPLDGWTPVETPSFDGSSSSGETSSMTTTRNPPQPLGAPTSPRHTSEGSEGRNKVAVAARRMISASVSMTSVSVSFNKEQQRRKLVMVRMEDALFGWSSVDNMWHVDGKLRNLTTVDTCTFDPLVAVPVYPEVFGIGQQGGALVSFKFEEFVSPQLPVDAATEKPNTALGRHSSFLAVEVDAGRLVYLQQLAMEVVDYLFEAVLGPIMDTPIPTPDLDAATDDGAATTAATAASGAEDETGEIGETKDMGDMGETGKTEEIVTRSKLLGFEISLINPVVLFPESATSTDYLELTAANVVVRRDYSGQDAATQAEYVEHMLSRMQIQVSTLDLLLGNVGRPSTPGAHRSLVEEPVTCDITIRQPFYKASQREPRMEVDSNISQIRVRLHKSGYDLLRSTIDRNFNAVAFHHPSQYVL